jgi:hypothetical protein
MEEGAECDQRDYARLLIRRGTLAEAVSLASRDLAEVRLNLAAIETAARALHGTVRSREHSCPWLRLYVLDPSDSKFCVALSSSETRSGLDARSRIWLDGTSCVFARSDRSTSDNQFSKEGHSWDLKLCGVDSARAVLTDT